MPILLTQVVDRLTHLNYPYTPADDALLNYNIKKVTEYVKAQTNQYDIPNGAIYVAIDMVVGEFLSLKFEMGQLDSSFIEITVGTAVSQVRDGDTQVTYAIDKDSTPEANFKRFLDTLINPGVNWGHWRRLRWC